MVGIINPMRVLNVRDRKVRDILIDRLLRRKKVVAVVEHEADITKLKGKKVDIVIKT